jgi:hypothetical protein
VNDPSRLNKSRGSFDNQTAVDDGLEASFVSVKAAFELGVLIAESTDCDGEL